MVVCLTLGLGIMAFFIFLIYLTTLNALHHMRSDVITAVGYRSTEVGYLQRREVHLTLSDGYAYHRQSAPLLKRIVIELCIGNHSPLLTRQIYAKGITETHAHHVVTP